MRVRTRDLMSFSMLTCALSVMDPAQDQPVSGDIRLRLELSDK